jgi:hypothetical protein
LLVNRPGFAGCDAARLEQGRRHRGDFLVELDQLSSTVATDGELILSLAGSDRPVVPPDKSQVIPGISSAGHYRFILFLRAMASRSMTVIDSPEQVGLAS